jgi:hypothetical protein
MRAYKAPQSVGPAWFDLEKYEKQKALDLPGWLLQFGFRRDLQTYIAHHDEKAAELTIDELVREMLRLIHHDPILSLEDIVKRFGSSLTRAVFPGLAALIDPQPRNRMGVHPTTVEELYKAQANLFSEIRDHTDGLFNQLQRGIEDQRGSLEFSVELDNRLHLRKLALTQEEETGVGPKSPYDSLLRHPLYCSTGTISQETLFTANLSLPDKILVEQFQNSLKRARSYVSKADSFSARLPKSFSKVWIDRQLLAFIDLYIEKQLPGGLQMSRSEIGKLISPPFQDSSDGGEGKDWEEQAVKDTVEPLAEEMLADHSDTFWMLEAAAAAHLAKKSLDRQPPESMVAALQKPVTRRSRWRNK